MSKQKELDAFIAEKVRGNIALPKGALDDMRYFAKRAKEGTVISLAGIVQWMEEKHGVKAGRSKLYNAMVQIGEKPWWTK